MRTLMPLAAAASLVLASPAWSQSVAAAPAVAAETEEARLGIEVIHIVFEAIGFESTMLAEFTKEMKGSFGEVKGRPEWEQLFRDAAAEEFAHDRTDIERLVGRKMAAGFTLAELRAGAAFLRTPGVAAALFDKSRPKDAPMPPDLKKASDRLEKSADGRSFVLKLGRTEVFDASEDEVMAMLLPGLLRRFGEKAEAAEAARAAAQ